MTAGDMNADPVPFNYGDQAWADADADHHCSFGAYDSDSRQGDCGFTC